MVGVKAATLSSEEQKTATEKKKPRVLVAGGGIGGLVFALAAKKKGFDVLVFEKDLSAIRGEGQYRGPIQIQSNALAALEAIDIGVAEEVMEAGCITGDRINGLVDGVCGTWWCSGSRGSGDALLWQSELRLHAGGEYSIAVLQRYLLIITLLLKK